MRNEEALLPMWLAHHKTIFDHGIIVDYDSTDRSREIIREICPTWEVRPTTVRRENGDAVFVPWFTDKELQRIEKELDGFKQILNTTEFLVVTDPNIKETLKSTVIYTPTGWEMIGRAPADPTELLELLDAVSCVESTGGRSRVLHDQKPACYQAGRHALRGRTATGARMKYTYHPAMFVFHLCTPFPYSERFYMRALGVKDILPRVYAGRVTGGRQHFKSRELFEECAAEQQKRAADAPNVWDMTPEPGTPEQALHYWRAMVVANQDGSCL
jgi:hypothetical protein